MKLNELTQKYEVIQKEMKMSSDRFSWENKQYYSLWLRQTYEYACHSTRILALTAGHFNPYQTSFSNRFIQHAAEEKGHDKLLLNDAKSLGITLENMPLLPEAEAFHKSLYFWIYQHKPLVILGWVLCLEGFAVHCGKSIFERVEKSHGKKASSFVYVHSKEDEDHLKKAFETLKNLNEDEISEVYRGLKLYSSLYTNIFNSIESYQSEALVQQIA